MKELPKTPDPGAGLLVMSKGEILLGQRSAHVGHPHSWSYPGGKIEPGETPLQTALREFREETSYSGRLILNGLLHIYRYQGFVFYTYLAQAKEKFEAKPNSETDSFGWFDLFGQLPSPLLWGSEIVFEKAKKMFSPQHRILGQAVNILR